MASSTPVKEVVVAFANVEKMAEEAEEYIWTITDQYLISRSALASFTQAYNRDVKVKNIEATNWVVPKHHRALLTTEDKEVRHQARNNGLLQERLVERLDLCLYMSEKEVAVMAFPLDGRFDYLGFTSKDKRTHKWCSDIFQYYWKIGRNRYAMAEELYTWIKNRPKALHVLKKIAAGKEVLEGKDVIPELQKMSLIEQGRLTILGDLVYERFQQ